MQNSLPVQHINQAQFQPPIIEALLVDDNEFDRKHIKRMSVKSDLNIRVSEVSSISEMSKALHTRRFDLVLLDYNLQDGDGFDALQLVRENPLNNQTGIIMITGQNQTDIAVHAFRGGCHDFVSKNGLSSEKMKDAILRSLTGARAQVGADLKSLIAETIEGSLRSANLVHQLVEQANKHSRPSVIDGSAELIQFLNGLENEEDDPFLFRN
ncbi:MAG: response regulator [Pseudomonadota bacterium]